MTKIIISIIALVLAIALFVGYTKPTYEKIENVKKDIIKFDQALAKSRELQELKRGLLSRYNTFSERDLSRLNKLLPDHVDNVRLVLDLDNLASRYGMAVQNVLISKSVEENPQEVTVLGSLGVQNDKFDSLTLQFATVGSYSNFVRFLEDLESSLRIVDLIGLTIEEANISSEDEKDELEEPLYEYNVSIRTYWLK
jgi:Tfp pilus assembly protein PilO